MKTFESSNINKCVENKKFEQQTIQWAKITLYKKIFTQVNNFILATQIHLFVFETMRRIFTFCLYCLIMIVYNTTNKVFPIWVEMIHLPANRLFIAKPVHIPVNLIQGIKMFCCVRLKDFSITCLVFLKPIPS